MQPKTLRPILAIMAGILLFSACKKVQDVPATATTVTPVTTTTVSPDLIKDSALMYTKDLYLWYNQIPSTFDARSYADPSAIMTAIHPYSIEPGFTTAVDRWSFGMKKTDWDNLSGGLGVNFSSVSTTGDFGLGVFFLVEGDLRVKSVERLSPAGIAGIHRGWRVTKINGSSDITTGNSSFIIANVYNSTSSTFTFLKPDGTSVDITLSASTYRQQPVYLDSVYSIASKNIGYLVFNSFLGDTADIYNNFQRVFTNFANHNVTDVVVDLRYNGGGYVSVSQKLADYLVSPVANGGLMMKEQYNDKNAQYNDAAYFQKAGPFTPLHIYFIVTSSTASASELLINNLTPYMDVKLVGPTPTHGKPVGFFPIPVGDWYIFPVSFRSTNKNGSGNYFNGLPVNSTVADGLDKDWGDIQEASLGRAIKSITTGSFAPQYNETYTPQPAILQGNSRLDVNSFKGTVDTRGMR